MKRSQLRRGKPIRRSGKIRPRKVTKKVTTDGAPLRDIKDECDQLVREIVARRDHKCATCWAHYGLAVGHLFRRGIESVRWNLLNCGAQCDLCNSLHETEPEYYIGAFIQKHGEQAYIKLREESQRRGKFTYIYMLKIRDGLRREAGRVVR